MPEKLGTINPDCEYDAVIQTLLGNEHDGEPFSTANLPGSPERAMHEDDIDPASLPFCAAERCTLTLDLIQRWAVASTVDAPEAPQLADRVRINAATGCRMIRQLAEYPSSQVDK